MQQANSLDQLIGNTPILELKQFDTGKCRLFAKLENMNPTGSVKDRIALSMLNTAEESGLLKPNDTIVEGTAGNTGISLVMVAAPRGYQVCCVIPDKMSIDKVHLLESMGAKVLLTRSDVDTEHAEHFMNVSRVEGEKDKHLFIDQFANQANIDAHYQTTGPEIYQQMDSEIDAFICGVGTGGTLTGVGRYLKEQRQDIEILLTDPRGSMLAHEVDKNIPVETEAWLSEGIGTGFLPPLFDASVVDQALVVNAYDTAMYTHLFLRKAGLFVGPSSGAVLAAALRYCQAQESAKNVVMLVADGGQRYVDTVFNHQWLKEKGVELAL